MGSIHLTLNIDRVDLVVAISVVVIALMVFIGLIAWFVKSSRRNRTLKQIDSKLTPQQCEYIEYLAEQVETERKKAAKVSSKTSGKTGGEKPAAAAEKRKSIAVAMLLFGVKNGT